MKMKFFEIRDRHTCVPALAIQMDADGDPIAERFLRRCGYINCPTITVLMRLEDQRASSDPYWWNDRTHKVAHNYIYERFDQMESGDVVDVRVILGEALEPAKPEIVQRPTVLQETELRELREAAT